MNEISSPSREIKIPISSLTLAAKCWGPENGVPVLALHGWLDNAASFDHLAPLLPGMRLVSIDLAGHGLSGHRPEGTSYHFIDMVADVAEALENLGWSKFYLLGHSMGASVAACTAALMQKRVQGLVLIEGLGPLTQSAERAPEMLRESIRQWQGRKEKPPPVYRTVEEAVRTRHLVGGIMESSVNRLVERGLRKTETGYCWRSDQRLMLRSRIYLCEDQVCAFLRDITSPVLLIEAEHGRENRWRELVRRRLPEIPRLQRRILPGEHHLHLDNPKPVAMEIQAFMAEHGEE